MIGLRSRGRRRRDRRCGLIQVFRKRAERSLKTAETMLATIKTAVDALASDGVINFTTDTPVTPVTVTWAADEQRTYLEEVFQVQRAFLGEMSQTLAYSTYKGGYPTYKIDAVPQILMELAMSYLFSVGREGPEGQATLALYRLEMHRSQGVTLAPDGWIAAWDDPRTSAHRLAEQWREEEEEHDRMQEQQKEDDRRAWEEFKKEKRLEVGGTRRAEIDTRLAEIEERWHRGELGPTD